MLIPHVAALEANSPKSFCECCGVEPAKVALDVVNLLCVECAFQVARAFLEDLYLTFPAYCCEEESPSDELSPIERTHKTEAVISRSMREWLKNNSTSAAGNGRAGGTST